MIALLASGGPFEMADLYTITLHDSTVIRWTTADFDLVVGGNTYSAAGPLIQRSQTRVVTGLEVDSLKITIKRGDTLTLLGVPVPVAASNGALDGASIRVDRLIAPNWTDFSAGTVFLFEGNVSDVDAGSTEVRLEVKSELERLNVAMPHTVYQPQCSHALYDPGCGLVRASFTVTGTVGAGPTTTSIPSARAEASGYFVLGVLTMTSGPAAGAKRAVKAFASGLFTLALPLPAVPNVGDTFSVYPGCDKKQATCNSKFSNLTRFRGFPYVPRPEQAR